MKILKIVFISTLLIANISFAIESYVVLKVGNSIITNIDIINEKKYLILLNSKLKELSRSEVISLAKRSLIKEKIKKKELEKYFKFEDEEENDYINETIKKLYLRLNLENLDDYRAYLQQNGLIERDIKRKIEIETKWNELIYNKFSSEIEIDEIKIKKRTEKELKQQMFLKKINLSEILFDAVNKEEIDKKYQLILNKINDTNFETAASLYSISDTSTLNGSIGWINQNQLTENIRIEIEKIKVGEFTKPIRIPGGFLILYINDIKKEKNEVNIDELSRKIINYEKNYQLNNFSKIYLNKVKQNIEIKKISEK